ncbi:MAG: DNA polymerase III subunit delta [Anaerovoracaceae bacterium]|jgi:DNA polymerase-3 subunit delta
MGASNSRHSNKTHAFMQMSKDMKSEAIGNPLLLCGVESFLVDWAKNELICKYVNEATRAIDLVVLDEEDISLGKIIEACETLPLFSEKKVVILSNFLPIAGKKEKSISAHDMEELCKYITDLPRTTQLIFTLYGPPTKERQGKTALLKAVEATGRVYEFDLLSQEDVRKFIIKRMKGAGKYAKPGVISKLIVESGYVNQDVDYSLYNLENDMRKLFSLSEEEEITMELLDAAISNNLEHNVFKLLDAVSTNRKDDAFRRLHDLLLSGANAFQLHALIVSQLELMLMGKEMRAEGRPLGQIEKELKVHAYRLQKAMSFAERHTVEDLRRMLYIALEVEKNIKTGILGQDLALEMLVAEM